MRGCRGDDHVAVRRQAVNGNVGLDSTSVIQQLGVNQLAHGHVDVACTQVLQEDTGVSALD